MTSQNHLTRPLASVADTRTDLSSGQHERYSTSGHWGKSSFTGRSLREPHTQQLGLDGSVVSKKGLGADVVSIPGGGGIHVIRERQQQSVCLPCVLKCVVQYSNISATRVFPKDSNFGAPCPSQRSRVGHADQPVYSKEITCLVEASHKFVDGGQGARRKNTVPQPSHAQPGRLLLF